MTQNNIKPKGENKKSKEINGVVTNQAAINNNIFLEANDKLPKAYSINL